MFSDDDVRRERTFADLWRMGGCSLFKPEAHGNILYMFYTDPLYSTFYFTLDSNY